MIQQTNISKPWNRPGNNGNYGKAFNSHDNNSKMEHILIFREWHVRDQQKIKVCNIPTESLHPEFLLLRIIY